MDISSLKGRLPNEILESLAARGISVLTPPQEDAIKEGLLDRKNLVIASPTASGKTLVAEIACLNSILSTGKRAIYIAPMRALASEKFEEFKEAYPYISAAISIGDLDSNDLWLRNYKMLFFSTEKLDSLIRHGADWLNSIGCIIFDEVHMLGDMTRGPTLELLITKLDVMCDAQMIALSATIGNSEEIAKWMKAKLVKSDYRPVKLTKGVLYETNIHSIGEKGRLSSNELLGRSEIPEIRLVEDTLLQKKQALIFYSTKRNAEAGAIRIAGHVAGKLSSEEKLELEVISTNVLNVLSRPTEQCTKLSNLVAKGVAFHHSGLMNQQRSIIEDAFRNNKIKAICSTTTLAYGINMPAHTVLVRDSSRFDGNYNEPIGINEITQLFGRAGRPKYDKEGRAIIMASSTNKIRELAHLITGEPEPVNSALGVAPVLRTHILAFIAENFLNNEKAMQKFISKTFYGFQYGNESHIKRIIDDILEELADWDFIENDKNDYRATRLGKRVSELYIDPLSAKWMVDSLNGGKLDMLGILYMISNTLEMRPYLSATKEAEGAYAAYLFMTKASGASGIYSKYEYYDPVRAFSTALMLRDWMDEVKEFELARKYGSTPGAVYTKLTNADWLVYAASELARITRMPRQDLIQTRVRLRYGIKEELLDLVRLEQIGRVRARQLFSNGIEKVSDIQRNREKVVEILGEEIAERVFKQIE